MSVFRPAWEELDCWGDKLIMSWPGHLGVLLRRICLPCRLASMGKQCLILERVRIVHKAGLSLGDHVGLSPDVQVNAYGGVTVGRDTLIGPGVKIWSVNHRFQDVNTPIREQGYDFKPVWIEEDVWIGANAVILPGVRVQCRAIVAAGAVVTEDVPPLCIVGGIPAKPIGWRGRKGKE